MSSRSSLNSPHHTGRRSAADSTAEAPDPTSVLATAATPTAASVAPSAPAASAPADALEAPTFQLSIKQLLAGAAAAITAAVLGSRLGVAGTLIGAGLASSVSMIAAAVYSHSLATAAYKVKLARAHSDSIAATPTEPIAPVHQAWGELPTVAVAPAVRPPLPATRGWRSRWVAAGVGVVAACAIALLAVTGIEAVRGTPLSGGSAGGLSVLGGASVGTADTPATGRTVVTTDPQTVPASPSVSAPADPTSADSSAPSTSATVTSTVTVTPVVPSTSAEPTSEPSTSAAPTTAGTSATTQAPTTSVDPTTTAVPSATVPPANERATAAP